MCDTAVTLTDDGILFAKNSDRDPNEAQILEWHPAARHDGGTPTACTWITVPPVTSTHAVLLSRPWWMWGAEMGANDRGVVIGNEAVFTHEPRGDPALLGMDLVRLALERSATAHDAVGTIVGLLEAHGQGGPCSHERPGFTYDNSFLVADPSTAVVLETAGRHWATEEVRGPARSISNGLTIEPFATAHADRLRERINGCVPRRTATEDAARRATGPADLMAALRDHGPTGGPAWSRLHGTLRAPCVHAGGTVASSQTTASWVADLRGTPRHWVTATAAPCTSVFKPFRVEDPVDLGVAPTNRADPASLWWAHERLHRLALADLPAVLSRLAPARARLEAAWQADPPGSVEAVAQARELEAGWLAGLEEDPPRDRRPRWVRRAWTRIDTGAQRCPPTPGTTPTGRSRP